MKDKMEDFIREQRAAFDDLEPNPAIWDRIDEALPVQRKARIIPWRRLMVAASLLMLVGLVGFWAYNAGMKQGV